MTLLTAINHTYVRTNLKMQDEVVSGVSWGVDRLQSGSFFLKDVAVIYVSVIYAGRKLGVRRIRTPKLEDWRIGLPYRRIILGFYLHVKLASVANLSNVSHYLCDSANVVVVPVGQEYSRELDDTFVVKSLLQVGKVPLGM